MVDQVIWTREDESLDVPAEERKKNRKQACFEEKESARWLEMLQRGEQIARSVPNTKFVIVGDSESDIGEIFCEASDLAQNCDFIIRRSHPHSIKSAVDSATGKSIDAKTVDEALSQAQWRTEQLIEVSERDAPTRPDDKKRARKQERTARETSVSLRAITIELAGPRRPGGGSLRDVTLNVVEVLELSPIADEPPIRWVLFTTRPILTIENLLSITGGYCLRWPVELFFKTLKSGLKIEDMKYETLERYYVAFSMLTVVAWRVEYLKGICRTDPEGSAQKYFTPSEWMAIMAFLRKPVDPSNPPTTKEFMIAIAQLGGYINKKSQGDPGSKTICEAWRVLTLLSKPLPRLSK